MEIYNLSETIIKARVRHGKTNYSLVYNTDGGDVIVGKSLFIIGTIPANGMTGDQFKANAEKMLSSFLGK
jgi:hypothetical protein